MVSLFVFIFYSFFFLEETEIIPNSFTEGPVDLLEQETLSPYTYPLYDSSTFPPDDQSSCTQDSFINLNFP